MKIFKYIGIGLLTVAGLTSCSSDYLDTKYTETLDSDATADAAGRNPAGFTNGIWSWMSTAGTTSSSHDDFSYMSVLWSTQLMTEDVAMQGSNWGLFDQQIDNRLENYRRTNVDWTVFYTLVAKANEIIGLYPDGATSDEAKGLLGQAYAIRGMAYTYLIQLYQAYENTDGTINNDAPGVPIIYTAADGKSADEMTAAKGRNTVKAVFDAIESDLTKSVELLDGYERASKNDIDQSVAYGLLARYYLLSQQYDKAATAAASARKGYTIMGESDLKGGFMDVENAEWMWGFDQTAETQTTYASYFSMMSTSAPGYAGLGQNTPCIDAKLYGQISDDDYRKADWFNGPSGNPDASNPGAKFPYANTKFGWKAGWLMDYLYMRASEMVLIQAEALAHQNKETEAATVLKELMSKRQPSWNRTSVTVEDVYLQRRIELWGEGFSYFDLKRLNKGIDRTYSGNNYQAAYAIAVPAGDKRWTYQIPQKEMQENQQLTKDDQNE